MCLLRERPVAAKEHFAATNQYLKWEISIFGGNRPTIVPTPTPTPALAWLQDCQHTSCRLIRGSPQRHVSFGSDLYHRLVCVGAADLDKTKPKYKDQWEMLAICVHVLSVHFYLTLPPGWHSDFKLDFTPLSYLCQNWLTNWSIWDICFSFYCGYLLCFIHLIQSSSFSSSYVYCY